MNLRSSSRKNEQQGVHILERNFLAAHTHPQAEEYTALLMRGWMFQRNAWVVVENGEKNRKLGVK